MVASIIVGHGPSGEYFAYHLTRGRSTSYLSPIGEFSHLSLEAAFMLAATFDRTVGLDDIVVIVPTEGGHQIMRATHSPGSQSVGQLQSLVTITIPDDMLVALNSNAHLLNIRYTADTKQRSGSSYRAAVVVVKDTFYVIIEDETQFEHSVQIANCLSALDIELDELVFLVFPFRDGMRVHLLTDYDVISSTPYDDTSSFPHFIL